jgi:hypothetical protein
MKSRKPQIIDLPGYRQISRMGRSTITALLLFTFFLSSELYALPVTAQENGSPSPLFVTLIALGAVAIAVLAVIVLTVWSRKQDHISNMAVFCMRSLVNHPDESERCEAARSLSHANDPAVLLVMIDILSDQNADEQFRLVARESLLEMSTHYRKYKEVIANIISAIDQGDAQEVIDILTEQFEKTGRKYAQTALIIGRLIFQLGHYNTAREWLRKAESRNRKNSLYDNQIRPLIKTCNEHILQKGDSLFKEGRYAEARERFAALSHHLSLEEKQNYALHLRLACVYYKLGDFDDANQALLLALQDGHETDMSIRLKHALDESGTEKAKSPEPSGVAGMIEQHVSNIMEHLASNKGLMANKI